VLEKTYRHHFDRDWYDVSHHQNFKDGTLLPVASFVDAFSIDCTDPQCKMRFDINEASGTYCLWLGCRTIQTVRFDRHLMALTGTDRIDPIVVCRKLQVMA
jgi:hypothetical protein